MAPICNDVVAVRSYRARRHANLMTHFGRMRRGRYRKLSMRYGSYRKLMVTVPFRDVPYGISVQ